VSFFSCHLLHRERAVAAGQLVAATALQNPLLAADLLHVQSTDALGWALSLKWAPPQPVEWLARRSQSQARQREVAQLVREQEWALSAARTQRRAG
jgi:hypothetical protein